MIMSPTSRAAPVCTSGTVPRWPPEIDPEKPPACYPDGGCSPPTWDNGGVSQPTERRPPQVTMAVGDGHVRLVDGAGHRLGAPRPGSARWRPQEAIGELLADPPIGRLGLDVAGVTRASAIACLVIAASACATGILG